MFHYGAPFTLTYGLGAVTFPVSGLSSGFADYAHTGQLLGLEVFDSAGRPVSNAVITAPGGEQIKLLVPQNRARQDACSQWGWGMGAVRRRRLTGKHVIPPQ